MGQSLKNKTMIVTGASSGIGRAVAKRFAAEGVKLALVARSAQKLKALADELGSECVAVPLDLTRPADVATMVSVTAERFGHIDILFANAGSYVAGKVACGDPEEWDRVVAQHVELGKTIGEHILAGAPLHPPSTATTVRVRDGKVTLTDGPYVEGAEVANGFYVLRAPDRDTAVKLAAQIPATTVQVRQLAGIAGL